MLLLISQGSLFLRRKKGLSYGMIQDKATNLPISLAIVRLSEASNGRTVKTRVTDREGRYLLIAPAGKFTSEFRAINHVSADIPVSLPKGGAVTGHVALEPISDTRSAQEIARQSWNKKAKTILAFTGPVVAFLSVAVTPEPFQVGILLLNMAVFAAFLRLSSTPKPKRWGTVRGPLGAPLGRVVVRIVEAQYGRVLESQMTDASGMYAFLVGPNTYYLRFEKEGYRTLQTEPIDLTGAKGVAVIDKNVVLEKA